MFQLELYIYKKRNEKKPSENKNVGKVIILFRGLEINENLKADD